MPSDGRGRHGGAHRPGGSRPDVLGWTLVRGLVPLWLGVLAVGLPGTPLARPARSYAPPEPAQLDAILRAGAGASPERIERLTRDLKGAPYVSSPLGEGTPPDADPRFRLDAFDCTTFVETAIALTRASDAAAIPSALDQIRYRSRDIAYANRRHLVVSQWVPGLIADGYLEDVTREVGGADTRTMVVELTPARWRSRRVARDLELPPDAVPSGRFEVAYLPLSAVLAAPERVPPGTVLNVIRADVQWSPDPVVHQGLVVVRPGETTRMVRHASLIAHRVVDEPLDRMMRRYLHERRLDRPIIGIALLRIMPARPR